MSQLYGFLQSAVPQTRLISYSQFVSSGQKAKIQNYILYLLNASSEPLTTREISNVSGIEIGSLTSPLLSLTKQNKIIRSCLKKNLKTRRASIAYCVNLI